MGWLMFLFHVVSREKISIHCKQKRIFTVMLGNQLTSVSIMTNQLYN